MVQFLTHFGYIAVALAMFAEGLTLPCPAVAILLTAGAAVATNKLSLWPIVFISSIAYTVGSIIPYFLGSNIVYLQKFAWAEHLIQKSAKHIERLGRLFNKHGDIIVALSRPFWIGNFVSYFAGLARMSLIKFSILTFGGIFAWSLTVVSLGEMFSNNIPRAAALIKQYSAIAMVAVVVLLVGAYYLNGYIKSHLAQN